MRIQIIPFVLTISIIMRAEGVAKDAAIKRMKKLRGLCGKAKPTVFHYFENSGLTIQDVAFSFGQTYAQRFKEAKEWE